MAAILRCAEGTWHPSLHGDVELLCSIPYFRAFLRTAKKEVPFVETALSAFQAEPAKGRRPTWPNWDISLP